MAGSAVTLPAWSERFIRGSSNAVAAPEGDNPGALVTVTATEMIDSTQEGKGRRNDAPGRRIEITIEHLSGGIASVRACVTATSICCS
jgi:hypothetical protein